MSVKGLKIIKRDVVSLSEAAEIGRIDNIVFDRHAKVAALVIQQRGKKRERAATGIANVSAIGPDAITIEDSEKVEGSERIEELHSLPNLRQLVGCRVITEGGTYLGLIRDVVLDIEARCITDFDLVGRGVLGRFRGDTIPATGRLRFGREIVIVPNAVATKGRAVLEPIAERESFVATTQPSATGAPEAILATNPEVKQMDAPEEGLTRAVGG